MTEQESRRGKTRRERVEFARSRDIFGCCKRAPDGAGSIWTRLSMERT